MTNALQLLWHEPRPAAVPARAGWNALMVAVVALAIGFEVALRSDMVWRPLTVALGMVLAGALLFRRSHPFASFVCTFGALQVVTLAAYLGEVAWTCPSSYAVTLLFAYSLFRWGSGREVMLGLLILAGGYLVTAVSGELADVGEAIGGALVLLFPAALAASVRFRVKSQQREFEQLKLLEREKLARELHDSVAHYVSAIAIQAQAGRAMAATKPQAALERLAVIEEAASRTLTEMRRIVGALRDDEAAELAPQRGLAELAQLAENVADRVPVEVVCSGDLSELAPSLNAALYRLAQESITNARRHAQHASCIHVEVRRAGRSVELTVRDDGERQRQPAQAHAQGGLVGYGLAGMAERVALLGGHFEAGPQPSRGWKVYASLPTDKGAT